MASINKEQIEILVRLQGIETECQRIAAQIETVPQQYQTLEARLTSFQEEINAETEQLEELRKRYRLHDADLQANLTKVRKSEEKSRAVKNNKEYQSILKEIDDLTRQNAQIEDEMLVCLEKIEAQEVGVTEKKAEHKGLEAEVKAAQRKIKQETEADRANLARLQADMETVERQLAPDLLALFLKVKQRFNNSATIVAVKNAVCQGCNMNIPPQMYNELQRCDSLHYCPHCQRMIYWQNVNNDK